MAISDETSGGEFAPLRSHRDRRGWEAVLALLLAAISSGAAALVTVGRLKDAAIHAVLHGLPFGFADAWGLLGPVDAGLAAASAALVGLLMYLEWRRGALSELLRRPTAWQAFAVVTIVDAWMGQAYLFPGMLLGGDSGSHIARFLEVRQGLAVGTLPQWSNFDYLGSPLLGFTGPLLYVVGGALDVLLYDPVLTAKTLLFAAHIAAGWLCYALLLRLGIGRTGAMLAAIGFAGSFSLLHIFLFRGEYPQAFTIVFLLLVFYAAEGIMRSGRRLWRDWLVFAVSVGGLTVNHQPHALFTGIYLAMFGAMSLLLGRWTWSRLWALVTAGMFGVGMSLVAVLPIVLEADWVMINPTGTIPRLHLPTLEKLSHLVLWRNTRTTWGGDSWAYLGLVQVGLASIGGIVAVRGRLGPAHRRLALAIVPGLALSFFLYTPIVRNVMFMLLFVTVLAALGIEWVARTRPKGIMLIGLAAALLVDVASTSVQPIARRDKEFLVEAGRYLARVAPNERFMEVGLERDGSVQAVVGPVAGPANAYATVQRVAGVHNMAATRVHNFAITVLVDAAQELDKTGQISERDLTLLRLLNVSRIVCFSSIAAGCPKRFVDSIEEGPLGRVVPVSDHSPVIFSRHLVDLRPPAGLEKPMLWLENFTLNPPSLQISGIEAFLDRYLRVAQIAPDGRLAAALPVDSGGLDLVPSVDSPDWHAMLSSYKVGLETVQIRVDATGPGYVQLSHPWYPGNHVFVNGAVVAPLRSAVDLLVVPLHAGVNEIEIRPVLTPVRFYSAVASALMLGFALTIAIGLAVLENRRGLPADPDPYQAR